MPLKLPELPRARGIRGVGRRRKPRSMKPPRMPTEFHVTENMDAQTRQAYYSLCGEDVTRAKLANGFTALKQKYPAITLPEAILYMLLEERDIEFDYQSSVLGGRSELGGYVVDFLILMGGYVIAVLVNGDYWHTQPTQVMRDMETKQAVVGMDYQGMLITMCLEIWESTLLSCERESAVDSLLVGVEVGRR